MLLAAILVAGPLMMGGARLWSELPLFGAVALLLALQGVRLALRKSSDEAPRRIDAIDWSVVLFVLYAFVRWLTSPTEYFSRIEVMAVTAYAGIFFTCRYGVVNRKYGVFLLYLLVGLGVGEMIFGYYFSNHPDRVPFDLNGQLQQHYAPRWLGTYDGPNHFASLLVMAIGAALALGSFSKLPWPARIVLFYAALMMMVGVMYSGSKGSWIALVAAIAALAVLGIRNGTLRWWVPVTGAVVLIVVAGFLFSTSNVVRDRLVEAGNLVHEGRLGNYVRVALTRDALHIARDHPFFGTGPGTFVFVHPRYQDQTFKFKAILTHDDYLNCLDDYGLVGFGLAMLFAGAVTLKFFRPLHVDQRWQDRVLVAAGFAAWVALLVHSVLDFNLHIPANAILLFALTGLALARIKQEEAVVRHWSTVSLNRLGPWPGLAILTMAVTFGVWVIPAAVSDIIYENALARVNEVPNSDSIDGVQEALKDDKGNAQAWVFLGDLHRYQASRRQGTGDSLEEGRQALEAYRQAVRANPLDNTVQARMGMMFDIMREYPEAFSCYRKAVMAEPFNGQFWYDLGNHYWESGMLAKAELAFLRSERCPYGGQGSGDAEKQLRALPEMEGVPQPASDADPLSADAPTDNGATIQ